MNFKINSDYFPKRRLLIGFCTGDALCFCGAGTEHLNTIYMNLISLRIDEGKRAKEGL
jgi:hypothetical protein